VSQSIGVVYLLCKDDQPLGIQTHSLAKFFCKVLLVSLMSAAVTRDLLDSSQQLPCFKVGE
jgi:hypothetical protein